MKPRFSPRWFAVTGAFLVLLAAVQAVTGFGFHGISDFLRLVLTGACVDFLLTAAVYGGGFWCSFACAVFAPLCALLLRTEPGPASLVPWSCLGNLSYVSLLFALGRRDRLYERAGGVGMSSLARGIALNITIIRLALPSLHAAGSVSSETGSFLWARFTWVQILTALLGGCAAALCWPALKILRERAKTEEEEPPSL